MVDGFVNRAGGGVGDELLLIGLDEGRGELGVIGPLIDAKRADVDVRLRESCWLFGDEVHAVVRTNDVVVRSNVE